MPDGPLPEPRARVEMGEPVWFTKDDLFKVLDHLHASRPTPEGLAFNTEATGPG